MHISLARKIFTPFPYVFLGQLTKTPSGAYDTRILFEHGCALMCHHSIEVDVVPVLSGTSHDMLKLMCKSGCLQRNIVRCNGHIIGILQTGPKNWCRARSVEDCLDAF